MPPAETPDFDSMSPEEVMAWMESLAKRQGAKEGFVTDANMEIAEIDPSTVEIDEPGYVPYGEESSTPKAKVPRAEPPAAPPPPPPPVVEAEVEEEPEVEEPVTEVNLLDEPPLGDEDTVIEIEEGSLAWLESLAADQTSGFPQMDLEALSAEIAEVPEEPEPARANPMDWLESLAEGDDEPLTQPEIEAEFDFEPDEIEEPEMEEDIEVEGDIDYASITDPMAAGIDPMLWLESLARRQGAKSEELTTSADMDIPVPENATDTGPGYAAYSLEDESRSDLTERSARQTLDPAAWLESMATASAAPEEVEDETMSDDQIRQALSKGSDISSEQMGKFFERQLDRGLSDADAPPFELEEEYDPDAPPVPAELPDWLLEQVQPPGEDIQSVSEEDAEDEDHQPALLDELVEPPAADLPDWLKVDESQEADLELESIFESTGEIGSDQDEAEVLMSDPWVQAFAEEAESNPDEIPEWYEQNLRDPDRIAAVERQMGVEAEVSASLEDANLPPESELSEGEPQPVPAWAAVDYVAQAEAEAEPLAEIPDWLSDAGPQEAAEEIPDWLAAADVEVAPDEIPAWLRDTVETDELVEEEEVISAPEPVVPEPEPEPVVAIAAPPPPAPRPVPLPAPAADVAATLESARSKASDGDVDGCLVEYESIVRANAALEHVVSDLTQLAEHHQENPAVYRVLGDGLMRQGKLQAALDTYRKALNQL